MPRSRPAERPCRCPTGRQPEYTPIPSLSTLTLNAVDVVNQAQPVFETPASVHLPRVKPGHCRKHQQLLADQHQRITTPTSRSTSTRRSFVALNPVLDPTGTYILEYTGPGQSDVLAWACPPVSTSSSHTRPSCNIPASPMPPATRWTTRSLPGRGHQGLRHQFRHSAQAGVHHEHGAREHVQLHRLDGHRRRAIVLRAAAFNRDSQYSRQCVSASDGGRPRLLQPAALRPTTRTTFS